MLLLHSGIRRGELCGLEWPDVDFDNNLLNFFIVRFVSKPDVQLITDNFHRILDHNREPAHFIPLSLVIILLKYSHMAVFKIAMWHFFIQV